MITLDRPPVPVPVVLRGQPWRPAPRRMISQIEVRPEIDAPINIELGGLPMIAAAAIASGLSFVVAWQVPSIRSIATIAGVAFAGFGIANLFLAQPEEAAADEPIVTPAGGGSATVSPPIASTNEDAFAALEARVISPTEWQEVDLSPFAGSVPITMRITNPANSSVTFDLIMDMTEDPTPGEAWQTESSMRVTLGGGETRDITTELPLSKWTAWVDLIEVDLVLRKRRIAGGPKELMFHRAFVIE